MKIGIIGSGTFGQVLGAGFSSRHHEVQIGTRDPANERVQSWASMARASLGTFAQTAAFGEVLVLATLWSGTENAIHLADPENFKGKIVLDVTNPLSFTPNEAPSLALGHRDSGGEQVQRWLPDARVVKVFNMVGSPHVIQPDFPGGPPDMFICGNDEEAKKKAAQFCADFGWPAIDMGGIESSRLLEPLGILWLLYGIRTGSWNHAFKLLRK